MSWRREKILHDFNFPFEVMSMEDAVSVIAHALVRFQHKPQASANV